MLRADSRRYEAYLASRPASWEVAAVKLIIGLCREFRGPAQISTDLAAYFTAKAQAGAFRVEPALAARFFLGTLFSYVVGRKLWDSAVPDRATLDGIVDVFLNGVRS